MTINERIDQIAATLAELRDAATVEERRPAADGRRSRQLVDALFRSVHTFKAAAAAEGWTDLSRTAHEFENLLHSIRTGHVALDAEILRGCNETVAALREGSQPAAINRVHEPTHQTLASDKRRGAFATQGDLPAEFANLKDDERHRALAAMREGATLYVMEVAFDVSDFDERFRRLKEQLERDAEPISTSATMDEDAITFKVVYASRCEKIPVQSVLRQATRAGQAVAAALNKQIEFVVKANELLLEKPVADALTDALLHLVRNAVDHGIGSSGQVVLEVRTADEQLQVSVTDDGHGVAPENLSRLFEPGFSTASDVTELSGRGVGLDAVKTAIENVGGSVNVASELDHGSVFQITIPNSSSDA